MIEIKEDFQYLTWLLDTITNYHKLYTLIYNIRWSSLTLFNWLYFIEPVTSFGPLGPKRIKEIEEMTKGGIARKNYVTTFLDFETFMKFSEALAWETEVWIADMSGHMIHLNGDIF